MQSEMEIIRNFCPHCMQLTDLNLNPFACTICGSGDLIPNPYKLEEREYVGEALGREEETGTPITPENPAGSFLLDEEDEQEEPKSKLKLDENAVNAMLNWQFGFLTGLAGTGKSTLINEIARLHPNHFEICATTGIAAVNLGSKTINSTLKYFDTKSLENAWREQLLHMNLRKIRARRKNLLIDEGSMLGGEQLDLIMNAVDEINMDGTGKELGIWISGDMMQLPPVKMKYVFKSDYWKDRFEPNTVRLTKCWRQDDLKFMEGINLIRANKGMEAMEVFKDCGVTFLDKVNDNFEGTTLIPNNNDVDSYNEKRLRDLPGTLIRSQIKKKGKPIPEWDKLIPIELRVKKGAYVMILSNDIPNFTYVNGDCGTIEDYSSDEDAFLIKLKRTGEVVKIKKILRENYFDREPEPYLFTPSFSPYISNMTNDWVIGTINYHPIRLAYASTIHKSQGLSLDVVQINTNPPFFGYDSMGYVSISRARTPEGLFLVGKPEVIGKKIKMNPEVMKYV